MEYVNCYCAVKFVFRWYFGKIKRVEAEKKLLSSENEHGAFLIRDSESRRNDYSLSGKSCKESGPLSAQHGQTVVAF